MGPLSGSRVLRWGGALTLIASAVTFLFRDWEMVEHFPVYLQLLAVTVAMTAGGIICQLTLRESKGARTFLGLALAMVPINAAALGGLLYTAVTAAWEGVALGPTLLTVAASGGVLVAVSHVAHLAFVRPQARSLTWILAATCMVVVVPFREASMVLAVGVLGILAMLRLDQRRFASMPELRTWEGAGARAIAFAPFVILLGRTVLYYPHLLEAGHIAVLLSLVPMLLWTASNYTRNADWKVSLEVASVLPALVVCLYVAVEVVPTHLLGILGGSQELRMVVSFALLAAATCLVMGVFATRHQRFYQGGATWLILLLAVAPVLAESQGVGLGALLGIASGIGVGTYAYASRQGAAFLGSAVAVVLGLVAVVISSIDLAFFTHWASLAAFGVVAIVSASFYERHQDRIRGALRVLRARFVPSRETLEAL